MLGHFGKYCITQFTCVYVVIRSVQVVGEPGDQSGRRLVVVRLLGRPPQRWSTEFIKFIDRVRSQTVDVDCLRSNSVDELDELCRPALRRAAEETDHDQPAPGLVTRFTNNLNRAYHNVHASKLRDTILAEMPQHRKRSLRQIRDIFV